LSKIRVASWNVQNLGLAKLQPGTNNTPNLQNRFVIGAGNGDHYHTFSANHRGFETNGAQGLPPPNDGSPRWDSITSTTGDHHHSFITSGEGYGRAFTSMPLYKALFYIM
jgi:hypothetical protein